MGLTLCDKQGDISFSIDWQVQDTVKTNNLLASVHVSYNVISVYRSCNGFALSGAWWVAKWSRYEIALFPKRSMSPSVGKCEYHRTYCLNREYHLIVYKQHKIMMQSASQSRCTIERVNLVQRLHFLSWVGISSPFESFLYEALKRGYGVEVRDLTSLNQKRRDLGIWNGLVTGLGCSQQGVLFWNFQHTSPITKRVWYECKKY